MFCLVVMKVFTVVVVFSFSLCGLRGSGNLVVKVALSNKAKSYYTVSENKHFDTMLVGKCCFLDSCLHYVYMFCVLVV